MASYPGTVAIFLTYVDQDGQTHTATDGTDLTIDAAHITDQIHQEVIAVESSIGVRPFTTPGQKTMGASVVWLYESLSPITHTHLHYKMAHLTSDDHREYVRTDGSRGFSKPITSPPASGSHELINLSQIQGKGVTAGQMENLVKSSYPTNSVRGPAPGQTLKIQGGQTWGYSDENGNLWVPFNPPFAGLLSFVYVKLPFPGESMLGWYTYQYMEDQLVLMALNTTGALIQFIEDIRVDARALVALSWTAIGT